MEGTQPSAAGGDGAPTARYSRTCECRAPFGMPTKGMVEVSPEVPSRMTPFCRCTKTGPGKAIPTKWYTFSLFQSDVADNSTRVLRGNSLAHNI